MAVPALPANLAAGDVGPESWFDDVRALFAFFRDDLPVLRVTSTNQTISTATATQADLADAPGINNGGWTDTSTTYDGWNVPETGVYRVTALGIFAANATGHRQVAITDEATERNVAVVASSGSAGTTRFEVTDVFALGAGDELGIKVYQTSGFSMFVSTVLMAEFLYAL